MNQGEIESKFGERQEYLKYFLPSIILVVFVIIASIFSYAMLGAGFFTTQTPSYQVNNPTETITPSEKISAAEYNNLAVQFLEEKNYSGALDYAEKAIAISKIGTDGAYAVKVIILYMQGQKEEAQKTFNDRIASGIDLEIFNVALTNNAKNAGVELDLDGFIPQNKFAQDITLSNQDQLFIKTVSDAMKDIGNDLKTMGASASNNDWISFEQQSERLKIKVNQYQKDMNSLIVSSKYINAKEPANSFFNTVIMITADAKLMMDARRNGDQSSYDYYMNDLLKESNLASTYSTNTVNLIV